MTRSLRRLEPLEHQTQTSVVSLLRVDARPDVMVLGIHNELPKSEGKLIHFRKLGFKPGAADLLIIIDGKAHFLELKSKTGRQSDRQKHFGMECALKGIPYACCYSYDEAKAILSEWGALRTQARRAA